MAQPIRLPLIETESRSAVTNVSDQYRHLLFLALEDGAVPVPVETAGMRTAPIRLGVGMLARLEASAAKAGIDMKQAFASLCKAGLLIQERQRAHAAGLTNSFSASLDHSRFKSPQQAAFYAGMAAGLSEKKIVFCEGSTGLGKGRVIAMVALEQAKAGKTPVVVCAPSLALVGQLFTELVGLKDDSVPVAVVVGSHEFVDDEALRFYLERAESDLDMPVDEAVKQWVAGGAKPLNPHCVAAVAAGGGAAWLMDDLRSLCTEMAAEDFALSDEADNLERSEARAVVARMRERVKTVEGIVLCSHMMLASAQRTQWRGTLAAPKCIIIDEAHLFESAVSRVNSTQLSLFTLRATLQRYIQEAGLSPSTVAGHALREVAELGQQLQPLGQLGGNEVLNGDRASSDPRVGGVIQTLEVLGKRFGSRALTGLPHLAMFQASVNSILRGLRNEVRDQVRLSLSAVRGFPSLRSGPAIVAMQLGDIWKTAEGGVALVSATLYAIGEDGEYHCDYSRASLSVPIGRSATLAPVREPHITTIPTVWTLGEQSYARFIPSSERGDPGALAWRANIVGALEEICGSARGGTLALFTAYADVHAVGAVLRERLGERVIEQVPDRRFDSVVKEYREKHAKGLRPVMLALGVAWTGVDLVDSAAPPERDTLLTDLVVTRLPINLNQSATMRARVDNMGLYPLINECLLYLKQGLGRLIRRDGVEDRRIWILDGRIHSAYTWPGMVRLTAGVRRMLRDYPKRRETDFFC